jgi:hypothetical protein
MPATAQAGDETPIPYLVGKRARVHARTDASVLEGMVSRQTPDSIVLEPAS